jgi:2-polyprenyl-3-methyl-5-hydroxy-6-metoxy-1,4-benzoquinol methylase
MELIVINLKYLESIRLAELECILPEIKRDKPGRCNILEIGAGSGWQSKKLAENGYFVEAIDIDRSGYSKDRVWPIINYDGKHIPFPDEYFDIVFSSNVLEHIPDVIAFQNEIKRVLKPDGISVHVVPSGSWRFWTSVAHYAFIIKMIKNIIIKKLAPSTNGNTFNEPEIVAKINQLSKIQLVRKTAFASRHGEIGTELTELYYFSRYRWVNVFTITNWKIEKVFTNRLFYTGYGILGPAISLKSRRRLSYVLGSSCHIFVLRKVGSGVPVMRERPLLK